MSDKTHMVGNITFDGLVVENVGQGCWKTQSGEPNAGPRRSCDHRIEDRQDHPSHRVTVAL